MANDITVRLRADAGPLRRGMDDGSRSVRGFSDETKQMSLNVAKAGAAVVVAIAGIAAGVLKMASEAAAAGVEIKNLAAQASVSTTDFQKMAAATRTVGFEQDKLSDILKDVNDKFGDYMATGAGPLADFFENIAPKIGVTADQFAKLSGPDALQLYVSSLEQAGVSQQQMTFYMEALASDATSLLPLLRDNGREMARLGNEAERLGLILSQETIDAAVELDRELAVMANTIKTKATASVLEYKDELIEVVNFITEKMIPAMGSVFDAAVEFAQDIGIAVTALEGFLTAAENVLGLSGDPGSIQGGSGGEGLNVENLTAAGRAALGLPPLAPGEDPRFIGPTQPLTMDAGPPTLTPPGGGGLITPPGGGGGKKSELGLTDDDFDMLREAFATESEIISEARAQQLAELQAFKDAGIGTEEEYNDLEKRIKKTHNDDMAALDRAAMQARLRSVSGAFGDLSSLMTSENDKLFKIGKAAAIAEAVVSGYSAAVTAWDKGMSIGGPPVAAAFTGASLVKTGMLISQLKSASASGGGSTSAGGGGGGGATVPSGGGGGGQAAEQPVTTFQFTLQNDPMGFGEGFARQLIEQLNSTQRNGGKVRGVLNDG